MTENVENMLLKLMKRFQTTLDGVARDIRELKTRQNETHSAVVALRRDQANDAEIAAHLHVQMDMVKERIDRIERRLDLTN